jgi:hypothetical protein
MRIMIFITAACLFGYYLYITLSPEPEIIVEEAKDDTGMDRDQTEDLMRTIGYVQ